VEGGTHDLRLDGGVDLLVGGADEDVIAGEIGQGDETLLGIVSDHGPVEVVQGVVAEQVEVIHARRGGGEDPLPIPPELRHVDQRGRRVASGRLRHSPRLLQGRLSAAAPSQLGLAHHRVVSPLWRLHSLARTDRDLWAKGNGRENEM
jgi:hypothetical protein